MLGVFRVRHTREQRRKLRVQLYSSSGTHSVTFTSPRIVQRGASAGPLAVSGTYSSASADAVQVKVFLSADNSTVVDWADVDVSLGGGVWAGSVTIPEGGPYYCQSRLLDSGDNVLVTSSSSSSIICGDVFVSLGQSNADGRGTNQQTYGGGSVAWIVRQSGTVDTTLNDPVSDDTALGSFVPLLATLISAHVGSSVPIAFINQTAAGTGLHNSNWLPPVGAQWVLADALVDGLNLNGIKAVFWWQGESDVVAAISQANYTTSEQTLATNVNAWPGNPPLISTLTGQQSAETDADIDNIRFAKIANWNSGATKPGANTIDINIADGGGDGLHFKTDAELAAVAGRIWLALQNAVYSGTNGRGPRVASATYSGSTVTVAMDLALATATTYTATAWIVKDGGTPVAVSAVAKSGTTNVVLTLAAAPSGIVTVTFGSGDDAIVADLPRAESIALPATINGVSEMLMPAEPFRDYTAAELPLPPSGPTAAASGTNTINLTWADNSDNETGFLIEVSLNGSSGWWTVATTAANATSYSHTGLDGGTTYYYRISALNASGASTYATTNATTEAHPVVPGGSVPGVLFGFAALRNTLRIRGQNCDDPRLTEAQRVECRKRRERLSRVR